MKQKDLTTDVVKIEIPQKPKMFATSNGLWPMCPNCNRRLPLRYDEAHDGWVYDERCAVCGQLILDVQKDGW